MSKHSDDIEALCADFRRRLETFYGELRLAPPYHGIEKAIAELKRELGALAPEERVRAAGDPSRRWTLYRDAFVQSGLNQRHRGIIIQAVRSGAVKDSLREFEPFFSTFDA